MNPDTDAVTWTPGELDGGRSLSIDIGDTDNGVPPSSATQTVSINVAEVNQPPALGKITNAEIDKENEWTFTATVSDPDLPGGITESAVPSSSPSRRPGAPR